MPLSTNAFKGIGTLIAVGLFVVAGFLLPAVRGNVGLSVVFMLVIFAAFGILLRTWFRKHPEK